MVSGAIEWYRLLCFSIHWVLLLGNLVTRKAGQNVYEIPTRGTTFDRRPPSFSLIKTFPVTSNVEKGFTFTPRDKFVMLKVPVDWARFESTLEGRNGGGGWSKFGSH